MPLAEESLADYAERLIRTACPIDRITRNGVIFHPAAVDAEVARVRALLQEDPQALGIHVLYKAEVGLRAGAAL